MTDYDVYLFREGKNCRLYEKLGAHQMEVDGVSGTHFAVWAPNARKVSLIGDFNSWKRSSAPLFSRADGSGIWEGFVPGLGNGSLYKYHIASKYDGYSVDKADPFAFFSETPPRTASVVWDLAHSWTDEEWASARRRVNSLGSPFSVYECHLGSWRRVPEEHNRPLSYSETAQSLPGYLKEMGYSHVEFLPVMEHPFYGSWGYQIAGFFAPTSRYGTPQDCMTLVDRLHAAGTGVILDWVPSHFPTDEYALGYFDGTHLYEYADPRKAFNPDWRSYVFDYGRNEVRSFLMSSAAFWLDKYHADGLRLDAVSSMLYLDYSRGPGGWTPNIYGGRENLEAISFLRLLNETIYSNFPDRQMIAEESTAWPMVSRPTSAGGLGFGMKWNMGWMHDTLSYFSRDPAYRKHHQDELTFSLWYAFTENFMLPLSHDEVVHGKGSLLSKMPGDDWQKFANLRLLLGYMYGHPGKKLLFMGTDIGERAEWDHDRSLDWHLLGEGMHEGVHRWVRDLNRVYRTEPSLHGTDFEAKGFEWVDFADSDNSVISFLRKGAVDSPILVVCNCTPVPRHDYAVGVPAQGGWAELLNSDAREYGGGGLGNLTPLTARNDRHHGRPHSVSLTLPPLAVLFLKPVSWPTKRAAQEPR
ncbi:MAG: 1,4-alpha-glucan branching protein GlgB [Nitrososphaerales archaeon]